MISRQDIIDAIHECERERQSYQTCQKLATFYTLLDHLYPERPTERIAPAAYYSERAKDESEKVVSVKGNSDLMQAIRGKDAQKAWGVMDELMQTVQALHPRMYDAVLDKLRDL